MFTARSRQNAFAKRRREVREAQQADTPPAEPTAVPYDTRNAESADVVDAPDVATFAAGGSVDRPGYPGPRGAEHMHAPAADEFPPTEEQTRAADELSQLGQEVDPTPVPPVPVELAPVLSADTRAKVDAVLNHAITPVADSAPVESEPEPEPAAAPAESEPKRGRGRPRPLETIVRDGKVYDLLKAADPDEGVSKEALAISLDEKEQQVYSSLRQLSKEGRAETRYVKGHGYRWFALQGD